MKLIVGLGNPGRAYAMTRHNVGFMVVDRLATDASISIKRSECQALIGRAEIEGVEVTLAKPQTYMNLSGRAVACLAAMYELRPEEMIVVVDDFALPLGRLRVRRKGSAGGHNGLKSIIEELGTGDFPRLRLGIKPDDAIADTVEFVLSRFESDELPLVDEMIDQAVAALKTMLREGVERTMSSFN
jgi:PTH1 family peptidyl-tRNA hydrolase